MNIAEEIQTVSFYDASHIAFSFVAGFLTCAVLVLAVMAIRAAWRNR